MSDHRWQDVALLPTEQGGAGWIAAERYRCKCGVERRVSYGTDKDGNATREGLTWIYFVNGKRIGRAPQCTQQ